MMHKLLFFCVAPEQHESLWRPIDLAVKQDMAEYRDALQAQQFRASLMELPLQDNETVEERMAQLPKIRVEDWMALYLLEPAYHTGIARCLPGASLLFVCEGQEHIARDYLAKNVACVKLLPGKTGRYFPKFPPSGFLPADLFTNPEPEDQWTPYHGIA
jgi:hypothetical protein